MENLSLYLTKEGWEVIVRAGIPLACGAVGGLVGALLGEGTKGVGAGLLFSGVSIIAYKEILKKDPSLYLTESLSMGSGLGLILCG